MTRAPRHRSAPWQPHSFVLFVTILSKCFWTISSMPGSKSQLFFQECMRWYLFLFSPGLSGSGLYMFVDFVFLCLTLRDPGFVFFLVSHSDRNHRRFDVWSLSSSVSGLRCTLACVSVVGAIRVPPGPTCILAECWRVLAESWRGPARSREVCVEGCLVWWCGLSAAPG